MRISMLGCAVTAVAMMGCGNSTGPAVERNDGGTGTATLQVNADIDATDVIGGFTTDFSVMVRDGLGDPVSGATVTIQNATLGLVTLLENGLNSGVYEATENTFPDGDFELTVERGTDNVRGVIVGGPGVHTITAPLANDTISVDQPLTVSWEAPSVAKSAEVETRNFGPLVMPDSGVVMVPAADLTTRGNERVRVFRFNEVDIAGGLTGSLFRVEVRQTAAPLVVQ